MGKARRTVRKIGTSFCGGKISSQAFSKVHEINSKRDTGSSPNPPELSRMFSSSNNELE